MINKQQTNKSYGCNNVTHYVVWRAPVSLVILMWKLTIQSQIIKTNLPFNPFISILTKAKL